MEKEKKSYLERMCVNLFKNIDSLDSIHAVADVERNTIQLFLVFIIAHQAAETSMVHGVKKLKEFFPDLNIQVRQLDYKHQDIIPKNANCIWYRPEKDRLFKPN